MNDVEMATKFVYHQVEKHGEIYGGLRPRAPNHRSKELMKIISHDSKENVEPNNIDANSESILTRIKSHLL